MRCPSPCFGSACSHAMARGRGSREGPSALYSRSSKARGTRRRMRGFEGRGRHLRSGPATAAKATCALTHPSNLARDHQAHHHTIISIHWPSPLSQSVHVPSQVQSVTPVRLGGSRVKRRDRVGKGRRRGAGRVHRAIPEERREKAGQTGGEGDDGDALAPARGDAQDPRPERLGRRAAGGAGSTPRRGRARTRDAPPW